MDSERWSRDWVWRCSAAELHLPGIPKHSVLRLLDGSPRLIRVKPFHLLELFKSVRSKVFLVNHAVVTHDKGPLPPLILPTFVLRLKLLLMLMSLWPQPQPQPLPQ